MVTIGKRVFVLVIFEAIYIAAVDGLQCPDCTFMTTNVQVPQSKDIIQKIKDKFSDHVCSAEIVDRSISGIKYQTCTRPVPGSVSKCRHYRGQVTVKAFGQELILNVSERGCYEDTISNMPSDGCFQRTNDHRDKSLIQTVINMDEVNFRGKMCICSSTESDCQNTSGSQGAVLSIESDRQNTSGSQGAVLSTESDRQNTSGSQGAVLSTESDRQNTSGSQGAVLSTVILIASFVSNLFLI